MLATLLALAAAPITVARVLGGGWHSPVPQLASLALWVVPVWLLAALLLVLSRSWLLLAVPVLALVLHAVWLLPTLTGPRAPDGEGRTLQVLTVNAHLGLADPEGILAAVRRHRVDVLVVVELTSELQASLAPLLASELPFTSATGRGGPAGSGIWARQQLDQMPPQPGTTFVTPRGRLNLDGTEVTVTAVHTVSPRVGQVQRWQGDLALIRQTVDAQPGPQLVLGDFNAGRDHAGFRRLLDVGLVDAADMRGRTGWPGFTWPADQPGPPFTMLDHVLVTPDLFGVRAVRTLQLPDTDHLAVLATLVVRS